MRDSIEIGAVPYDESCQQVGTDSYDPAMARRQCRAFIGQIRRVVGVEPDGANLRIKSNPHDFGSYLEVVCDFDDSNEPAMEYAFACEAADIANWDDEARRELQGE